MTTATINPDDTLNTNWTTPVVKMCIRDRYCSEYCFTPAEALLRQGDNIFDAIAISDRITQIRILLPQQPGPYKPHLLKSPISSPG